MKVESYCSQMPLKAPEDVKEEKQETTLSLANAN